MRREIATLKQQLQGRGDVDEGTLVQLARMGISDREEEKRMKNEEELRLVTVVMACDVQQLEERVKEAESDAVRLGERLREANRALEEEKNKNTVLTAQLEVMAKAVGDARGCEVLSETLGETLGEALSPEAMKEVDISNGRERSDLTGTCW